MLLVEIMLARWKQVRAYPADALPDETPAP